MSVATETSELRTYTFVYETRSVGDNLQIEGYAAVWNQPSPVTDFRGRYTETMKQGSFKKTLSENRPHLLYEHGMHPMIGRLPPGVLDRAAEDTRGVHIRGRLFKNWMTDPIRDAVAGGAISGMSFEQIVTREEWTQNRSQRSVLEVRCPEVSIVLDPVYSGTEIALRSLRSLDRIVQNDPEIRAAIDAAISDGTSTDVTATPPLQEHLSVPEDLLAAYTRHLNRRRF